jgi:hypothetical protein
MPAQQAAETTTERRPAGDDHEAPGSAVRLDLRFGPPHFPQLAQSMPRSWRRKRLRAPQRSQRPVGKGACPLSRQRTRRRSRRERRCALPLVRSRLTTAGRSRCLLPPGAGHYRTALAAVQAPGGRRAGALSHRPQYRRPRQGVQGSSRAPRRGARADCQDLPVLGRCRSHPCRQRHS